MKRLTAEEFIKRAREVHGDKYDYSKVNYINSKAPVTIICPTHGEFYCSPNNHISNKSGCPYCNGGVKIDTVEFIRRARQVHGDKYDYSKVNYINSNTPVTIICPIHGEFEQLPSVHLSNHGCPKCNGSRLESTVRLYLISNGIEFIEQMKWPWLVYKQPQFVDFYLPQLNIGIECQGLQHFSPSRLFDRNPITYQERLEQDINKQKLCLLNGVKLYYFSNLSTKNTKFNYPYLVFEDMDLLIKDAQTNNLLL